MLQLTVGLVLSLVSAPAPATSPSAGWGGSWATVQKAARSVKAVNATFVQSKSMKILRRPLISRGVFQYRAGGAITWEYTSPLRSKLVLSGGRAVRYLWRNGRYVADANSRTGAMQMVLAEIKLWMRGLFRKSLAFRARLRPGSPSRIVLTPLNKAISRFIKRIELTLGQQRGTIGVVTIYEQAQATTRIQITTARVIYR